MRSFNSPEVFGSFLLSLIPAIETATQRALDDGAHLVFEDAVARIGHYDGNNWPQLADVTQKERVKLGWTPNDPLKRSGALQESITVEVRHSEAVVGVPSLVVGAGTRADPVRNIGDIAVDQELGTSRIPPRPFLAPAGAAQAGNVQNAVAHAAADALCGKRYTAHKNVTAVDHSVPF